METSMNAIRVETFGGPEVLQLKRVELARPGPGEVLVRVKAAGVNPYDTYMRAGQYGARNPALPYTPGSDAAGTVELLGPDTNGLKVGDRVYTSGTVTGAYAQYALCRRDQVHTLPASVNYPQGATLYVPYATAYRALVQLARVKPGETVLIHGASGGVGTAAIQWTRNLGMTVFGTAGSEDGLRLIRDEGVQRAFNHREPTYREEILEATNGRGVDVVLEMFANVNLGHDLKLLAHRGRVVVIGSRGDAQLTPRDLMSREASVFGIMLWATPAADAAEVYAAIEAGLRNQALRPVVALELPLADAAEAHRLVIESRATGKIVLLP
jgi:NADPH2:quinone reductase